MLDLHYRRQMDKLERTLDGFPWQTASVYAIVMLQVFKYTSCIYFARILGSISGGVVLTGLAASTVANTMACTSG